MLGTGSQAVADLRRALALDPRDRRWIGRAWVACLLVVLGIRLLSLRRLRKSLAWVAPLPEPTPDPSAEIDRIVQAVQAASRRVPGGDSCLPRAVAGAVLLRRAGYPATVRIGVDIDDPAEQGALVDTAVELSPRDQSFQAHAWVVSHDKVVIGDDPELHSIRPLGDLWR